MNKLYKLEALRGLAAFYVMLSHVAPMSMTVLGIKISYFFRFGQEAVILFFLLSGFVISYSFNSSNNKSFDIYFIKRFTRIYIPLIMIFIIGYVLKSLETGTPIQFGAENLIGNLLMLQDWGFAKPNVIVEPFLGNNPLWSLSYEWWFYMAFYPIVRYAGNKPATDVTVYAVSILAAVVYIFFPTFVPRIVMYFAIWWTGVYLSRLYIEGALFALKDIALPAASLLAICTILSADIYLERQDGASLLFGTHPVLEFRHFVFALAALISAVAWKHLNWRFFDILIKPFLVFAPISYAIYISHFHLFVDASYFSWIQNSTIEWFAYFATTIAVSYLIEIKAYPYLKKPIVSFIFRRTQTA